MAAFDVTPAEIEHIRMAKSREAAADKHVPDTLKGLALLGNFQGHESPHLFIREIDDLLLGMLQCGAECPVGEIGVVAHVGRPLEEPLEVSQFLLYGGVLQADNVLLIVIAITLGLPRSPQLL